MDPSYQELEINKKDNQKPNRYVTPQYLCVAIGIAACMTTAYYVGFSAGKQLAEQQKIQQLSEIYEIFNFDNRLKAAIQALNKINDINLNQPTNIN